MAERQTHRSRKAVVFAPLVTTILLSRRCSVKLIARVVSRYLKAVSTPLPSSFPETEIGLMTADEFLKFRNPDSKSHPSDSYDFDIFMMNRDHPRWSGSVGSYGSEMVRVEELSAGFRVLDSEDKLIGIIHNGVAYYDRPQSRRRIPTAVMGHRDERKDLGVKTWKQVKYLSEVAPLVSPIAKKNETEYPVLLQHIIVKGEPMTVRAEKTPKEDAHVTLVILNSEGFKVAQAADEWGATLLTVAQEYRGKGLGKIIGQYWYDYNPSSSSGGFTDAGRKNALALWKDRVREFTARGWYSELVRQGRLSKARLREILSGVGERVERVLETKPEAKVKPTGDILVYVDDDISFIVYDRAFLEEQDDRFIHGFGFFRDSPHVGVFIYRIEYDRAFADLTTRVALQMARDSGDDLYDGEGYHDLVEAEGIPGVVRDGDYLKVTRDLLPVKALAAKERSIRRRSDEYGEKLTMLLELAEAKWN